MRCNIKLDSVFIKNYKGSIFLTKNSIGVKYSPTLFIIQPEYITRGNNIFLSY